METKLPTASPKAPEAPSGEVPTKTEGKAPSATDQQESKPAKATVAGPEERSPLSGLGLIEDGQDIAEAMESDSWVAQSLASFGTAMDMQQLVSDPIQTLMSWGIAWLLDHMSPLNKWLNDLTGDPGEVQGFAGTWASIGETLQSNSSDLARSLVTDLEGQEGAGISAYTALQSDIAQHIELAGTCSNAMSTALGVASTIVQVVHDLVRDAIADIVSAIAEKAAELAISCGTLAPKVIKDVVSLALEWAGKLRKYVDDLLSSSKKLSKLSDDLSNMLTRLKDALANIKSGVKDTIAEHTGKGGNKSATPDGEFKPPEPKAWDEDGGYVESRYFNNGAGRDGNGARIDYQFDKDGNFMGAQWWHNEDNVASSRPKDLEERQNFRDQNPDSVSQLTDPTKTKEYKYDSGHVANAHLLPDSHKRILDPDYDVKSVFRGEHADAESAVDKVRTYMKDNPDSSWKNAVSKAGLDPNERNAIDALEKKETGLNLFGMEQKVNRAGTTRDGDPSYYSKFERPYVMGLSKNENISDGAWVASELRIAGTKFERPESFSMQVTTAGGDNVQVLDSQMYRNVPQDAMLPN